MSNLVKEEEMRRETDVIQGPRRPALSKDPRLAEQGVR
jgi:hypothetical protein